MKLPNNALGVSDAQQWHDCPMLFVYNMQRHYLQEGQRDPQLVTQPQDSPLTYGTAFHEAAMNVALDPDIYLDDAVDLAWSKYSPYLKPEHHEELRQDVKVAIDRTVEATGLELVCAEEDMEVPLFIGREEGALDEEPGVWYKYRFRIDALYRRKDDPTHYVIRDFKTTRRKMFQQDVDENRQFTAYVFGVKELIDNAETVTIWYDQAKHGEIFSTRTDRELQSFAEWLQSTMIAVLNKPLEEAAQEFRLNEWCKWCPLLEKCGVVSYASDLALSEIATARGHFARGIKLAEPYVEKYERARQAKKALEGYEEIVKKWLSSNNGTYGGRTYTTVPTRKPSWNARDVFELVGEECLDLLPDLSAKALEGLLADEKYGEHLMALRKEGGYNTLRSREIKP